MALGGGTFLVQNKVLPGRTSILYPDQEPWGSWAKEAWSAWAWNWIGARRK